MICKETRSTTVRLGPADLPGPILNTILGIIRKLDGPYDAKPGLDGMAAYPPIAMAAVCIMLEAERTTYRKMAGIPKNNHYMAAKIYEVYPVPRPDNRAREISIRTTCYNIELVARSRVKDDRLTRNRIATLVA